MDDQQDAQLTQEQDVSDHDTQDEQALTNEEPQDTTTEEVVAEQPTYETEAESEEVEEEYVPYQVQAPGAPLPDIDFSNLPTDENGNVDAASLAQAIRGQNQAVLQQAQQMVQQVEERRAEERLWQKARDKYPELKSDRQLAEEVNALRFGLFAKDINEGKQSNMLTPAQAFDRINKRFATQRAEGIRQATESVKVQESVYVEPTQNAKKNEKAAEEALFQQMRSYDKTEREAATDALLKKRLFGG